MPIDSRSEINPKNARNSPNRKYNTNLPLTRNQAGESKS